MVAPNTETVTLNAFLENFCAAGADSHRTPEAGELVRTAQVQPGVYFTLEAPFVRILGLYSNCLEDPASSRRRTARIPASRTRSSGSSRRRSSAWSTRASGVLC